MDTHSPEQRSRNMSAIRSENTTPEIRVRSFLHSLGFRFRLHQKDLPGKPDIVLARHKTVVFVNGCFWHCHDCRYGRVTPATRSEYWIKKRNRNVVRDRENTAALEAMGWRVINIWECNTRSNSELKTILLKVAQVLKLRDSRRPRAMTL